MKLRIAWLYPLLMGTYGDRGNILSLKRRCEWRGIEVEISEIGPGTEGRALSESNLIFMGGAQDRQQKIVSEDILKNKGPRIVELVEKSVPALFVCASYQFMGRFYRTADGTELPGLGIFDLYTVSPKAGVSRCIGNIVIDIFPESLGLPIIGRQPTTLVGFENHGGRTFLGFKVQPLGKVVRGFGNNGKDGLEGAVFKNAVGCYFHGPLLPRNPHLADWLISRALGLDYFELPPLSDDLENQAHREALARV